MITVDFSRLGIRPGYRILDVGCGSGRHTCEASRFREVAAFGADINFDDLVRARNNLAFHEKVGEQGGGPWGTLAADITRLPFRDEYFDLVICSEVLEHIPEHERAVREMVRVLKPGRDLVVSVPRRLPERICWALSDDYYHSNGGHIRIYRTRELITLLESSGLRKWSVHFAHSLHSPYWWLKCLIGPTRNDSGLVNLYHSLLVWDMMKRPRITRTLDKLLNPLIGKSVVIYLRKEL